jgi:hypothetical protein
MADRGDGAKKISLDPALLNTQPMSISGQTTASGWFGPQAPLAPLAPPQVAGRVFDLVPGYNIISRPRQNEAISFDQLRQLADAYDIMRLVIETRKDQMDRIKWSFRAKKGKKVSDARIAAVEKFFERPDREHNFNQWLRMLMEDLLVLDAPTLWKQRTRGGDLYALRPLDGGTIKRVIDDWGRTPASPLPAYQQCLKGYPAVDYTVDDLVYAPRNIRTNRVYGYSPVEQIIILVNIALRRELGTMEYYTEGNVPAALCGVPDAWTPDQIKAFQDYWDLYFTGDTARRRKMKFVPGGVAKTFVPTKEPELKNVFDEWLAKVVCYAFSVSSQPFVSQVNRATANSQKEMAEEEGLVPILEWVVGLINPIIALDLGEPDVEIAVGGDEQIAPEVEATILNSYTGNAVMTRNEAREKLGLDPSTVPEADELGFTTPTGFVYLDETKKPEPPEPDPVLMPGQPKPVKTLGTAKKPATSAVKKPTDQPKKKVEKLDDLFDLSKNDTRGEARDSNGRFTSSGGPTTRERAKAERQRHMTEDEKARDNMGQFKTAKFDKHRLQKIGSTVVAKLSVAAAMAGVSVLSGKYKGASVILSAVEKTAAAMCAALLVSSADTTISTGIRMMGVDAEFANKAARIVRKSIKLAMDEMETAVDAVSGAKTEKMMKFDEVAEFSEDDLDKIFRISRYLLPIYAEKFASSVITGLEADGMDSDKVSTIDSSMDEAVTKFKTAVKSLHKSDETDDLRKGYRQLQPLTMDRVAVRKSKVAAFKTVSRALGRAGKLAATLLAGALPDSLQRVSKASGDDSDTPDSIAGRLDLSAIDEMVLSLGEDLGIAASDAAHRALVQIGPDSSSDLVGQASANAAEWARQHAAEMVGKKFDSNGDIVDDPRAAYSITESTRSMVKDVIVQGIESGDSAEDIVSRVQEVGFSRERAEEIVEAEVGNANSAGTLEGYKVAKSAGVDVKKGWLTVGDERVDDDICGPNEDQGPIPLDQPFQSGHMHPLGHPHCRCSLLAYVGSEDAPTEEESAEKMLKGFNETEHPRGSDGKFTTGDSSGSAATIVAGAVTVAGLAAAAYFGRGVIGKIAGPILGNRASGVTEIAQNTFKKSGITAKFFALTKDNVRDVLSGPFAGLDLAAKNTLKSVGGKLVHISDSKTGDTTAFIFGNISSSGDHFKIHWILPGNLATVKTIEDGVGQLGTKNVVALRDILAEKFPSLKSISGYRISGARTGHAENVTVRVRRKSDTA